MKNFLCGFDNLLNRNKADNNFNLDFRKQVHIHLNATIVSRSPFLDTTAKNVCNGDSGYADFIHSLHKLFQLVLTGNDNNLCKLMNAVCWDFRNEFSWSRRSGSNGKFSGSSHRNRNRSNSIANSKSVISTCKTMFFHIKTLNLFFSRYSKTYSMFDNLENNCHCNCNPCNCDKHSGKLYTKSVETAANKKTFPVCTSAIGEKTNSKSTKCTV